MRVRRLIVLSSAVIALGLVYAAVAFQRHRQMLANEHFFRLKVALTYKAKPVDIDIVVGCGVHDAFNVGAGGSTSEIMSMTAYEFAVAMPEGHAIKIRTVPGVNAGPCRGHTTASGNISSDWLPLIVWYDKDDNYAHGIAYATQDAYENPSAKFGFRNATIEHATRTDYDRFLETGPKNLLPAYLADFVTHPLPPISDMANVVAHPTAAWRYASKPSCLGVRRIPLTEAQRRKVRAVWPANHPQFWSFPTQKEQSDFLGEDLTPDQKHSTENYYDAEPSAEQRAERPKIYPTVAGDGLVTLKPQTAADRVYYDSAIDPAFLGFKYCDTFAEIDVVEAVTKKHIERRGLSNVDWILAINTTCRVNSYTVPGLKECRFNPFWVVFEDDKYAIVNEDATSF